MTIVSTLWQGILLLAGVFLLVFAGIPAIGYHIVNTGVVALTVLAVVCLAELYLMRYCKRRRRPWEIFARRSDGWCVLQKLLSLFLILFFAAELVLSGCMVQRGWFHRPVPGTAATAIVLGSKINGNQPSLMLERRLEKALEYLTAAPTAKVVVTGGTGLGEQYAEAKVQGDWLVARGVDASRILTDEQSENTYQNMQNAAALIAADGLPPQAVTFTDGFHQLRSQYYGGLFGLAATGVPSSTPWGLLPCYWLREQAAICRAYIIPG